MKFYKVINYGSSIPIDESEIPKIIKAMKVTTKTILFLKQGVVNLPTQISIVPDDTRMKKYHETPYQDERNEHKELENMFAIEEFKKLENK